MSELTIGIEEEYQIIDPQSRDLKSNIQQLLSEEEMTSDAPLKPEFMQSQVEVGSKICRNVQEARQEVKRLRRMVAERAAKSDCRIVAAGTHPFSHWEDQEITNQERYRLLLQDLRLPIRRLLIFGMHVHIGIPSTALRLDVMNQVRYFLPHILTLSTSSPFWLKKKTGLKSYRSVVFNNLPRTGIPGQFNSVQAYEAFTETLIETGCIQEPTQIWWDIRPHPKFPTLEFRCCDCVTKVDEVIAITALIQALVAKLIQLRQNNQAWRVYRRELIEENKWRAVRHGIDGRLIDFGKNKEVPVTDLIEELLELVDDVVDDLGSRGEIEYVRTMLAQGTSAERQLRRFEETGKLTAVVDMLAEETIADC